MRAYWILPNRDQNDDLRASDGRTIVPLRQVLDPKLRPAGFSHGVPTELLEKCGPGAFAKILFAQRFPGWDGNGQLFSVSGTAGVDSSGRVVHLGLLFILEPGERPQFAVPYAGLSDGDRVWARALTRRLTSPEPGDVWAQSVRDLIELPAGSGPATNVALERSVTRFHSLYAAGPAGSIRKTAAWGKWRAAAIVLLILSAAMGLWLSVRTGVVTWRFS